MKLLKEALDNDYPLLLVAAGHNQTGVLVHGSQKDLIYLLVKAMGMDKRLADTIIPAGDVFIKTATAAGVTDEVAKFLTKCVNDIVDVPGNEHNPLDCENCKEHGKCEAEKMWNELLIKKISNGKTYKA